MLNNIEHKNLRVITRPGAEFGDNVGTVMTVPTEFADVQREYPIFFRKDPQYRRVHLRRAAGLHEGREPVSWRATAGTRLRPRRGGARTVPDRLPGAPGRRRAATRARHPHRHGTSARQRHRRRAACSWSRAAIRRYLDRVAGILDGINDGLDVSKAMFAAFMAAELIEPVQLEIKFNAESSTTSSACTPSARRSCATSTPRRCTSCIARVSCRAPSWCWRR